MPQQHSITCDTCGHNLTTSGNSIDWRLALLNQRVPSAGGIVTDMMIYPEFEADAYFCGAVCLLTWVLEHVPERPS